MSDARADGRRRQVTLSPERVTIDRRYAGIAMRLSIPVEAYKGVCVGLKSSDAGVVTYELRLEHRDAELSVALGEALDDRDIWADWRAWAAYFGLPTLIERSEGVEPWGDAPRGRQSATAPVPARRRAKRRRAPFVRRHQAQGGAPRVMLDGVEMIART